MKNDIRKELGLNIRKKREELGLSQLELAVSVNKTTGAYIALIESGDRNVSAIDLMLIAKKLGTTVAELFGAKETRKVEVMDALRQDRKLGKKDREKVEEYYQLLINKNCVE